MKDLSKATHITSWVIAAVAAALFAAAGIVQVIGLTNDQFADWGYPASAAIVIGLFELLGAIGLLVPRLSGWAALLLMTIMLGAMVTLGVHDQYREMLIPLVMFLLLGFVVWWRGLAVAPTQQTPGSHGSARPA